MAKDFYETIIASGGFAGETFDLAVGEPGPNVGVIDVLLASGNGFLQKNAPLVMCSTGILGAPRTLDISGVEQDGRIFYLSVRNSDIAANNLTIAATTDINGAGSSFIVDTARDYIFFHEKGGTWRAVHVKLSQATSAQVYRATFVAADWTAGTNNQIVIIQSGAPGAGEIGPHSMDVAGSYIVQVYDDATNKAVEAGVAVDPGTGNITLSKGGLGANFDGRVIVLGTMA